ncbi:MAG: signal peptide peptidase SppA [Alphaproteobacteria bacterium]
MRDPDWLIDRRRLKRRLSVWRTVAILALVAATAVAAGQIVDDRRGDHIARLSISGVIVENRSIETALDAFANNDAAKALILRVNSPGGTVVGGEALYRALRKAGEAKPVVAVLGTVATSAAYMVALAADHVVAREGSITGSVGVILQTADITGLLERLGVKADAIKSAPLKGVPSPFEPLSPAGRAAAQAVVDDMFAMFVDLVAERRGMDPHEARTLADGRIFSGRQAHAAGLVDTLGGEDQARAWLSAARDIDSTLPVRDLAVPRAFESWLEHVGGMVGKTFFSEPLTLDGLISVWHPSLR